jgi:hypothetical protein
MIVRFLSVLFYGVWLEKSLNKTINKYIGSSYICLDYILKMILYIWHLFRDAFMLLFAERPAEAVFPRWIKKLVASGLKQLMYNHQVRTQINRQLLFNTNTLIPKPLDRPMNNSSPFPAQIQTC